MKAHLEMNICIRRSATLATFNTLDNNRILKIGSFEGRMFLASGNLKIWYFANIRLVIADVLSCHGVRMRRFGGPAKRTP